MRQSWSHKLFLRINAQIGKRPLLDRFMVFCATWLVWIMFFLIPIILVAKEQTLYQVTEMTVVVAVVIAIGFLVNWLIWIIWRRPRPVIEFPEITQLCQSIQTIKSFPSDHAMVAFCIAYFGAFFGVVYAICFLIMAVLVSIGRVYVGVHYPRDIIAGFIVVVLLLVPDFSQEVVISIAAEAGEFVAEVIFE